ncbi:hypothetical protein K402DRAFT_186817 [Aulographum hederae CBS 113979]|uniref:Mediator of RNA polymerase II transcription subunit 12 n=1 Tax=Aulographum hederae CBS 113979 TaxID=1176131 RepID=A0A6G1GPU2_9PEZI|nr:hypothetical protein K402DRAFT_186817 [Aulographum hederae CBS 113979]
MTSRSALGNQQPPPQRLPPRGAPKPPPPAARARSSAATARSAAGDARRPEVFIDLTDDIDKPSSSADSAAGDKGQLGSAGSSQTLLSPNTAQSAQQNAFQRGRSQLGVDTGSSQIAAQSSSGDYFAPLPFPPRPGNRQHGSKPKVSKLAHDGVKEPRKHNIVKPIAPPPEAICFPSGKAVDFFPWTGGHVEDVLNENVIKTGFVNKPIVAAEPNTGRPSFWPQVKNKGGLQILSNALVAVLDKRQALGRVTAPSTFKPPPRVTLTDTKREGWLKDLANPNCALRRLSRTIPHGIRGKVLLEQCLNKNIPVPRAVWLSKCVGANEMRAFKRKGATGPSTIGGATKWVREWTRDVEQFIEGTMALWSRENENWKIKMDYALRLASHLYSEQLLDKDHYLEWIVRSLKDSSIERIPLWLLQVEIYWKDLVAVRKWGCGIAESLLSCMDSVTNASDGVNVSFEFLINNLKRRIIILAESQKRCFIIPRIWKKYEQLLKSILPAGSSSRIMMELSNRNARLISTEAGSGKPRTTPRRQLFSLLDSVGLHVSFKTLSSDCLALFEDKRELVTALLQWASSIFRFGEHRTYIAIHLLRRWRSQSNDVDSTILGFLVKLQHLHGVDEQNVFQIIAELIRSRHFSASQYLQWLIANGVTFSKMDLQSGAPAYVRFIDAIPLDRLSYSDVNLRSMILKSLNADSAGEEKTISRVQDFVLQKLPDFTDEDPDPMQVDGDVDLGKQSITVKCSVGHWLRGEVAHHTTAPSRPRIVKFDVEDSSGEEEHMTVTPTQFYIIRDVFEQIGDYSVFADVLQIISNSSDSILLAAVADTLNHHPRTFAAIGALTPIYDNLVERHRILRNQQPLDRSFLLALADLCTNIEGDPRIAMQLKQDLLTMEQRAAVNVCSPVSDDMFQILQSTKSKSDDEIDQILASGTSMDEQIMSRVLERITMRLQQQLEEGTVEKANFSNWFYRLRAFDDRAFDKLATQWLLSLFADGTQQQLLHFAITALVGSRCKTLKSILEAGLGVSKAAHSIEQAGGVVLEVLRCALPTTTSESPSPTADAYRTRLEQQRLIDNFTTDLVPLLGQSLKVCSELKDQEALHSMLLSEPVSSHLRAMATNDSKMLSKLLETGLSRTSSSPTSQLLVHLVDPSNSIGVGNLASAEQISRLVDVADDISLPLCRLLKETLLREDDAAKEDGDIGLADAMLEVLKSAVDQEKPNWQELVSGLERDTARKVREHAEGQILLAASKLVSAPTTVGDKNSAIDSNVLQRYLTVIELTASSISPTGEAQMTQALIERLRSFAEILTPPPLSAAIDPPGDTQPTARADIHEIDTWLHPLLHLALLHKSSFSAKSTTPNQPQLPNHNESPSILPILCTLITHPHLQQAPTTISYLCDVAALFEDDLTDEARAQFARTEVPRSRRDPRIVFLFGSPDTGDSWLGLVTSANIAQTHAPPTPGPQTPAPQTPGPLGARGQAPGQPLPHQQQQQGGFWNRAALQQQQQQRPPNLQRQISQGQFQGLYQQQQQQGVYGGMNQAGRPGYAQQQQQQMGERGMGMTSTLPSQQQQQQQARQSPAPTPTNAANPNASPRPASPIPPTPNLNRSNTTNNHWNPPISFPIRRWEILPDTSTATAFYGPGAGVAMGGGVTVGSGANETAVSLALFGARRVG